MAATARTALEKALPRPKYTGEHEEAQRSAGPRIIAASEADRQLVRQQVGPPPYGRRAGWRPRSLADYGDGGAFPEIAVAQYPLDMGRKDQSSSKSNALAVTVNAEGKVNYDAIVRQGHNDKRIIHTSFKDLIPLRQQVAAGELSLDRPSEEQVAETKRKTEEALAKLVSSAVSAQKPKNVKGTSRAEPTYVRYTPASQMGDSSNKQDRIFKVVQKQIDPMEPPKFKHKKIPRGPPSPPAPVMRSPPRKLTAADQEAWKIPPAISSWKNPKGYTVPLDKRLAANGRGLQDVTINDRHAHLAEALGMADRAAREEVQQRQVMQRKIAEREKANKEEELRKMAQKAREDAAAARARQTAGAPQRRRRSSYDSRDSRDSRDSHDSRDTRGRSRTRSRSRSTGSSYDSYDSRSRSRSGSRPGRSGRRRSMTPTRRRRSRTRSGSRSRSVSSYYSDEEEDGRPQLTAEERAQRAREERRREHRQENQRELRRGRMGTERKLQVLAREQNRDISEQVALGLAKPTAAGGGQGVYDARLFNRDSGFNTGFNEDQPYDKPLFVAQDAINSIYRPRANAGDDGDDEEADPEAGRRELDRIGRQDRFEVLGRAKKGFRGADIADARTGPVQFEREREAVSIQNSDPFGIDAMIKEASGNAGGAGDGEKSGSKRYGIQGDRPAKRARVDDDDDGEGDGGRGSRRREDADDDDD